MAQRSKGITTIGYGLSIICGIILAFSMVALIMSFVNPEAVYNSHFFLGRFESVGEFQKFAIGLWILFLPQFVGLMALLRLKDWGRKLVIGASALTCFYFLSRMVFEFKGLESGSLLAAIAYGCVVLFFSLPGIKTQFQFQKEGSAAKQRVLIIDDDKGLLRMMKVSLLAHGFDVVTAGTGEKGIEIAKNDSPDLIILDVILPGIKGREVCARLKNETATARIPVIFLTAKNSPDDIQAELKLGAVSHLTKPLEPQQLLLEVNKVLKS